MMALARKIVRGDREDAETMEEVFAQVRNAEATAEELLVAYVCGFFCCPFFDGGCRAMASKR